VTVSPDGSFGTLPNLLRVRASLDGADTVMHFAGTVHAHFEDGTAQPLFGFDGYNVARVVEAEGGYDLLTREAVFYNDVGTGRPVDRWTNPFTNSEVDVVHIWNDPVNQKMREENPWGPFRVPVTEIDDQVMFNMDIFLAYPSPLPRSEFPENSQDDTYRAAELFQFFCKRADIEGAAPSVPALVSWTRLAPWLPFMRMGDRPGRLVYHGRGAKLRDGYPGLPAWMRERVESAKPEFATAPREITGPNETSWTYFRKLAAATR
jgi:hypothetical protein